jgi:membrane-associated phospholipid phosphatase
MPKVKPGIDKVISDMPKMQVTSDNSSSRTDGKHMLKRLSGYALGVFAIAGPMFFLDEQIALLVKNAQMPWLTHFGSISDIGKSENYLLPSLIVILLSFGIIRFSKSESLVSAFRYYRAQAIFLFTAVAVSGIITDIFKPMIGRARPRLIEMHGAHHFVPFSLDSTYLSMPSGHATTMGAVTCALCLWFPKLKYVILPLGFAIASARVFALAHYPSDVIIGFGLGAIYTLFLAHWLQQRDSGFALIGGRLTASENYFKFRKFW